MPTTTAEPAPASPSTSAPTTTTTTTTATTDLSPEALESNLITHLASTSALDDLHATLLASLQRAGWTERIRTLSLELLRAGRCERFDDVIDAVVTLAEGRTHPAVASNNNHNNDDNDDDNGELNGDVEKDDFAGAFFENVDVRIPRAVVDEGVKAIKQALKDAVVIEDESDREGGDGAAGEGEGKKDDNNSKGAVKTETGDAPATSLKNGHTASTGKKASKQQKSKPGKVAKSGQ